MKGKWKALGWKGVTMASLHQNDLILLLVGNLVSAPGHAWRMRFFPSSLTPSRKRNQETQCHRGHPAIAGEGAHPQGAAPLPSW